MARKRIKTLALEWAVSVEEVLQSSARLRLGHTHSESSLLAPEEADKIKADLDEQAHRAALLRRETVVETSAGIIVEKRLNATVMRRRHSETGPGAAPQDQPFNFELDRSEDTFVAPFIEEPPAPIIETPVLFDTEPEPAATAGAAAEAPAEEVGAMADEHAPEDDSGQSLAPITKAEEAAQMLSQEALARPEPPPRVEPPRAPIAEARPARNGGPTVVVTRPSTQVGDRGAINLTKGVQGGPTLDDGQRGPKVLGKIDLRPKTPVRPASPPMRPGQPPRPGSPSRFGATPQQPAPPDPGAQPGDTGKPGARGVKKRKVVKKGTVDFTAEREMRGLRVPKK
ncbi:MAG: hypothetical protein WA740_16290, partial [Candidatus Binataceae bacterium]